MMKLACALAFLAFAVSLPSPDTMVPEALLTQQEIINKNNRDAAAEAQAVVTALIQSGSDNEACAELAKTLLTEVGETVKSHQETLDALDDGASCIHEGQSEISTAEAELADAQEAAQSAAEHAASMAGASVAVGPVPLSSLVESDDRLCGEPISTVQYRQGKQAADGAAAQASEASAAIQGFEQALQSAKQEAEKSVKQCQCRAFNAYEAAYEEAQSDSDKNQKAWAKGKHMQCVVDGTAADDCDTHGAPTVKRATMAPGVDGQGCEEFVEPPHHECGLWTVCAKEGQQCLFEGVRKVRYGANGKWVEKSMHGGLCNNHNMGSDPIHGTVKHCFLFETLPCGGSWITCAHEGASCHTNGHTTLKYGSGDFWFIKKTTLPTVICNNNDMGGDPIHGTAKSCAYLTSSGSS